MGLIVLKSHPSGHGQPLNPVDKINVKTGKVVHQYPNFRAAAADLRLTETHMRDVLRKRKIIDGFMYRLNKTK